MQTFLDSRAGHWYNYNVQVEDGKVLHVLIVKRGFKRAVEIGTSTGHSTDWIAWVLSKTGGNLTTIEIDCDRFEEAKQNVADAGWNPEPLHP